MYRSRSVPSDQVNSDEYSLSTDYSLKILSSLKEMKTCSGNQFYVLKIALAI